MGGFYLVSVFLFPFFFSFSFPFWLFLCWNQWTCDSAQQVRQTAANSQRPIPHYQARVQIGPLPRHNIVQYSKCLILSEADIKKTCDSSFVCLDHWLVGCDLSGSGVGGLAQKSGMSSFFLARSQQMRWDVDDEFTYSLSMFSSTTTTTPRRGHWILPVVSPFEVEECHQKKERKVV